MTTLLTLSILVTLLVTMSTGAEIPPSSDVLGADTTKWTPFVCRENGIMGPNDDRLKGFADCAATHGPGKENPAECLFFCQAAELGLLDTEGHPKTEVYDPWSNVVFPERHQNAAKAWFRDCQQKFGNLMDRKDKTCEFAKKFGDCTWAFQPQLTCTN